MAATPFGAIRGRVRQPPGPAPTSPAYPPWAATEVRTIEGEAWQRALTLVREGDAVAESLLVARRYVDEACALLEPFGERPAAVALAGASRHLVDQISVPVR